MSRLSNLLILHVILLSTPLFAPCIFGADKAKPDSNQTRLELLQLHNIARLGRNKPPLQHNVKLSIAAQKYAEYLAKSGKFSHTARGTVSSRVNRTGYDQIAIGENIAAGQTTAKQVVQGWMRSDGHRKNMLNQRFTEVGFGIARDSNGRLVWVTDFGDR